MKNFLKKLKKFDIGKRQIVLSCLILFIAFAGYINLNYVENAEEVTEEITPVVAQPVVNEFDELKLERDKTKSETISVYKEIIDNDKSTMEAREKAQSDLSATVKTKETEILIESLLSAKGFEDSIVYIKDSSVNVIVKTDGLVPTEIAQIKDIVIENTGLNSENIKVIEKA